MFSFDVSFELILFTCVLKFKLVNKSTPRYLADDTRSRAFQERLTDFADLNRRFITYQPLNIRSLSNSMPVPSLFAKPRLFDYAELKRYHDYELHKICWYGGKQMS